MPVPTIAQPVPRKDITIKRGADFRLDLCIIERDEGGTAVVVDTAGWHVRLFVREKPAPTSPTIMAAATTSSTISVGIQGDPGQETNIRINVPAVTTSTIAHQGHAGYDMLVIYPDGSREFLLEGKAFVQPEYTYWS